MQNFAEVTVGCFKFQGNRANLGCTPGNLEYGSLNVDPFTKFILNMVELSPIYVC